MQGQLVPFDPKKQQPAPGQMVLYDPVSGGYFSSLAQTTGQDDYDSDDDTPPGFIERKCYPKTTCQWILCLACFFIIFTATGLAIGYSVIESKQVNLPDEPFNVKSDNMIFFLDNVLGNAPDFDKYGYDPLTMNQRFRNSWYNKTYMGGPITLDMQSNKNTVKVPDLGDLIYN